MTHGGEHSTGAARIVVFAWGNPSRGDDALGPAFLAEAEAIAGRTALDVAFVTDFQLEPEHATDLLARDLALFVDASATASPPFTFEAVAPRHDRSFTTHAMTPAALLATFGDAFATPPPAFVLAIRGERFELGEPLGAAARANLGAALAFWRQLLADATVDGWTRIAGVGSNLATIRRVLAWRERDDAGAPGA
jgi:hydrogenase maturation protease